MVVATARAPMVTETRAEAESPEGDGILLRATRPLGEIGVDWEDRVDWNALRQGRLTRVREGLEAAQLDGVLVQRLGNLRLLTSMRPFISLTYYPRYAAFLPTTGEPWLLAEAGDVAFAKRSMPWVEHIEGWSYHVEECVRTVVNVLRAAGAQTGRIGYDDIVSPAIVEGVKSRLPEVEFVDASESLTRAKSVKDAQELKVIVKAAEIVEIGMSAAIGAVAPGVRECDIAAAAAQAMLAAGADALVCYPQVSTDPLRRMGTDKRVHASDLVLIDLNVSYAGYMGDMARTVAVGTPTDEQRRVFQTQLECLRTALGMFTAGTPVAAIHETLAGIVGEAGLTDTWHQYLIGHGIGLDDIPYEEPLLGSATGYEPIIRSGMVAAIEPGFFHPGVGAVRNEDMVVAIGKQPVVLTSLPYDPKFG